MLSTHKPAALLICHDFHLLLAEGLNFLIINIFQLSVRNTKLALRIAKRRHRSFYSLQIV